MFQRFNLTTGAPIGEPGPLPEALVGLEEFVLLNPSAHLHPDAVTQLGLEGVGFEYVPPPPPEPPPPEPRRITRIGFLQRIPAEKRIAIRAAAKADPVIEDFLDLVSATDLIELDHPDTLMGVQYLVMIGHITQADAEALLA